MPEVGFQPDLGGLRSLGRFRGDPAPHEVAGVVAVVLVEVALVVLLGAPELRRRYDLGHDRLREVALHNNLRPEGLLLLLGIVGEDDRAVLVTEVGALAVECRRVVHVPEGVEQLRVRDPGRVVRDLDGFGVPGAARANLLVGHVVDVAALITRDGIDHARDLVEEVLDAPETSAGKSCFFHARAPAYAPTNGRQIGGIGTSYRRTRGGNGAARRHPGGPFRGHWPDGNLICLPG